MEIEKPFKCNICNAQFTNEDHLQVHKKRHEMSLNLTKSEGGGQSALEGFVDETPTPTRFFRNCEEVGLFQDLQNVNPFDLQFKAASSTPSGSNGPFDFSLAISAPSSSSLVSNSNNNNLNSSTNNNNNKRRYSDQDTLNTPQVFGYVMNSTSSTTNTCSTSSILTPTPLSMTVLDEIKNKTNNKGDITFEIIEEEPALSSPTLQFCSESESETTNESVKVVIDGNLSSFVVAKPSKPKKTSLKLKLTSPLIVCSNTSKNNEDDSPSAKISKTSTTSVVLEKKEMNRAAASRSRERRKQWVSNLETKCKTLETLLTQTRTELYKQQADNQLLRKELDRHSNCDVTRAVRLTTALEIPNQQIHLPVIENPSQQIQNEPKQVQQNILKQTSQPVVVVPDVCVNNQNVEESSPLSLLLPVKIKAKRGRPRKGTERRANTVAFNSPKPSPFDVSVKIRIPPISKKVDAS